MSDTDKLFDVALRHATNGHFKAYDPDIHREDDIHEWHEAIRATVRKTFGDMESAPEKRKIFPEVIGGLIDDPSVNAIAIKHEGRFFIGVTWGAPLMLVELYRRLLSDPSVLPWIGDASRESRKVIFSPTVLGHDASTIRRPPGPIQFKMPYPVDQERIEAVREFIFHALLGLVLHETAHAIGGHLDFLESKYHLPFIVESEYKDNPHGQHPLDLQVLELLADYEGVGNTLELFLRRAHGNQTNSFSIAVPGAREAAYMTLLCYDTLFRTFNLEPESGSDWSDRTHPPLFIRRRFIRQYLRRRLIDCKYQNIANEIEREEGIFGDFDKVSESLTGRLFGIAERPDPWKQFEEQATEYVKLLNDRSATIIKALKVYEYVAEGDAPAEALRPPG